MEIGGMPENLIFAMETMKEISIKDSISENLNITFYQVYLRTY